MARVALLVTVLAAVAYISQATPVPENVEDEQLKSKEIFDKIPPESKEILDQVQPESKEILDQVQPESKEILDQNQPKSEEILDQIQPKSEENLDQPDDTSKNEFEDSKNEDWRDHKEHLQNLKKKLELLLDDINQWKRKSIERKIEKIQQKIQRTRRNSPIDILNVNDIEEIFKLFNIEDIKKFSSFVQNTISKEIIVNLDRIHPIIEKFITQIGEKNEITEKAKKKLEEKLKEIIETSNDLEEDIKEKAKDFFKSALKNVFKNFEKVKETAEKIFENLKEQPNRFDENREKIEEGILNKIKEVKYFPGIINDFLRIGFDAPVNIFHDLTENIEKRITYLLSIITEAKINKFEDVRQKIKDIETIIVGKTIDSAKEAIKAIESKIGNVLKDFNDKVKSKIVIEEVIEEGKDKAKGIINNISKKFEDSPFNGFRDLSKRFLY